MEVGIDGTWPGAYLRTYLDVAGAGANRRLCTPIAFNVGALAAGTHTINFRDSWYAIGDSGNWYTAVLFGVG